MDNLITQDYLREILEYNPGTGVFIWRKNLGKRARAGNITGRIDNLGYCIIKISGRHYRAHRLAWLYVYGVWPSEDIDHIDGNRSNNVISNLREASKLQNARNARRRKDNTSGCKGVNWHKKVKSWTAQIGFGGAIIWLGCFETKEAALEAYEYAAVRLFGAFKRPILDNG